MPWLQQEEFTKTFETIKHILKRYDIKCSCGRKLYAKNLTQTESRTYEEGLLEYWIYCHCNYCDYDYNYEKIIRQWWNQSAIKRLQREFQEENK